MGGTRFPGSGTRFGGGDASHGCRVRDDAFFSDGGGDRDDAFFLRGPAKPQGLRPLDGGGAGAGAGAGSGAAGGVGGVGGVAGRARRFLQPAASCMSRCMTEGNLRPQFAHVRGGTTKPPENVSD